MIVQHLQVRAIRTSDIVTKYQS